MAADYDRLFESPEGVELPDETPAQTDFDLNAPSETPPMPTTLRKPNGHVPQPMPVDFDDQSPPVRPESPPAPMPVDSAEHSPPARPPMPVDLPQQPPSTRPPMRPNHLPQPTPVRSEPQRPPVPRAQAPSQHARHARREQRAPAELRNGRTDDSQHSHRARHANSENYRGAAETGLPIPPRTHTTSTPAPNGGPVASPALQQRKPGLAPAGPARAPAQPLVESPAARNGAPPPDPTSPAAIAEHGVKGATTHIGVKPAKKSATEMVSRRGWRRWVHKLTRINLGLSRDEKYELDLRGRIRRSPRGSYQIGVLGLKGGVGKTTVTVTLGSVLAQVRRDRILAFDSDAASGDLGQRVGRQSAATVADLLADDDLSHYNDVRTYTSANAVNLEVLAAAEYSTAHRAFSEADWHYAADAVSRFYNLVLADCGPGLFDPVTRGVLATVSGIAIVTSASIDGARQAAIAIDWLRNNGYQELLSRACVVINHAAPGVPNIVVADLVRQFEQHVRPGRVVVLPWDKHIAAGNEIEIGRLDPVYQRRITELAAALSDDFDRGERR